MKFGVRECCDVVLRAKSAQKIGHKIFYKNEPVCYFDTLKTSTFEGAATTVYAQGGRGNARLMSWDGERTVTFTMEDALISPVGLSILAGAGLIEAGNGKTITQHIAEQTSAIMNYPINVGTTQTPNIKNNIVAFIDQKPHISADPSIYVMILDDHGEVQSEPYLFSAITMSENTTKILSTGALGEASSNEIQYYKLEFAGVHSVANVEYANVILKADGTIYQTWDPTGGENGTGAYVTNYAGKYPIVFKDNLFKYASTKKQQMYYNNNSNDSESGTSDIANSDWQISTDKTILTLVGLTSMNPKAILVDYYTDHTSNAFEITITPDKFGGTYYLEASTLWRDQGTGQDLPAEFIIPNCKVQSNFSFTLSSSGDPSSFTFTMDAFPDYTRWDPDEKVFARIQVIGASTTSVDEVYREQTWAASQYEPIGGIIQGAKGEKIPNT